MTATWLADVLRAEGLTVVEHDGWKTRGHGDFTDLKAVVWHHDASAKGDSPGVPAFMLGNWDTAAAQLWVNRQGVWHVLAAGVAYHAGKVLPGKPTNHTSLGVETDHTTGENWPPALLTSLRLGTAAILHHLGQNATALHFHKTICSPVGRKSDPDGLDLTPERGLVQHLLNDHAGKPTWTASPHPAPADVITTAEEVPDMAGPVLLLVTSRVGPTKGNYVFDLGARTRRAIEVYEFRAHQAAGVPVFDSKTSKETAAYVPALIIDKSFKEIK